MRTCSLLWNWLRCALSCWCSMTGARRTRGRVWRCSRTGPLSSTWLFLCWLIWIRVQCFVSSLVLKDTIPILDYSLSGRKALLLSQGSREAPVWVGLGEDGSLVDSVAQHCAYSVAWWGRCCWLLSVGPWGVTCSPGSANSSTASCAASLSVW